jgi:hypothetical protein
VLPPGDPDSSGLAWPPPDSLPLGEGDAEPESEPDADGEPDSLPDGDPEGVPDSDPDWLADGEPDCGDGEPDCGGGEPDCDCGGGLPEPPVGVGGVCGGWLRKIRIAISTASAASSSISSQDTSTVCQPARS